MSRVVADGFHQLSQRGLVVGQSWTGIIVEKRGDRGRARESLGYVLLLTTNAVGEKDPWIDPGSHLIATGHQSGSGVKG